jgi:hypothetical protein
MAARQRRSGGGGDAGSGDGGGIASGSRPPNAIDSANVFAQASQRHLEYSDRIGPATVAVCSFASRISDSDVFDADKLAAVCLRALLFV